MINETQLDILKDIFACCEDDWLLRHVSIDLLGITRGIRIHIDKINCQDFDELREEQQ